MTHYSRPGTEQALTAIRAQIERELPPLSEISTPSFRTWNRGIWESALSSQTASHFSREEAGASVSLNEFVNLLQETGVRELDVWTRLYGLVGTGRAISPEELASLRQAISDVRLLHRTMSMAAIRGKQSLVYDDPTARHYRDRPLSGFGICKPIGTSR